MLPAPTDAADAVCVGCRRRFDVLTLAVVTGWERAAFVSVPPADPGAPDLCGACKARLIESLQKAVPCMSDLSWKRSLDFTLAYEGGYSNVPEDRGGETVRGISRRLWPKWPGWEAVDALRFGAPDPATFRAQLLADPEIRAQAVAFYRAEFWDAVGCDQLPGKVAAAVFDMAVHSGGRTAVKTLQVALDAAVDGVLGAKTVKAAHDAGEDGLQDFLAERARYLHNIMLNDPTQRGWVRNWFRRLFKLADLVLEGPGVEFAADAATV